MLFTINRYSCPPPGANGLPPYIVCYGVASAPSALRTITYGMSNADTTSPAIPFTAQMGTIFASQHDYLELYSNLRGMPPGGPWSQTIWYTSPDGASMVVYDIATGPQPKSSVLLAQIASTTTQTAAVATQIEDALNTKVVPELHNLHAAINALSKRLPGPPGGFDVHGSNGSNGGGPYLSPTPSPDTNS